MTIAWPPSEFDPTALTWRCHICGFERPDDRISVQKHHRKFPNGVAFEENVRFCNDNAECAEKALSFTFLRP